MFIRQYCSLIISTYNWPEALELCFMSVIKQSVLPHEIIVADDGSTDETRELITKYQKIFSVPLKHVWHADEGFRLAMIRNKAIAEATGDYIIQIDGDLILHPDFILDHFNHALRGTFNTGSRVLLTQNVSDKIIKFKKTALSWINRDFDLSINAIRLPRLSWIFNHIIKDNHMRGCNFAFWKVDFIKINGYNNNLSGWGHEDIELAARFINAGIKKKKLKLCAICYHLHHKINSRDREDTNYSVYQSVVAQKTIKCLNGFTEVENLMQETDEIQ